MLSIIERWGLLALRLPLWVAMWLQFMLTSGFWWTVLKLFIPNGRARPYPLPGGDTLRKIREAEGLTNDRDILLRI